MDDAEQEVLLTLRAAAGDRHAFDDLLQRIQGPLHGYIESLVGRSGIAEDILQDVFVRIYRKLPWLRDPELFRPWAYRIATRECWKRMKKERQSAVAIEGLEPEAAEATPEDRAMVAELADRLPALIAQLTPACRPVIALHYLREMTIEEVAVVLGISTGTAKSRLAYGLAGLRRQLKGDRA